MELEPPGAVFFLPGAGAGAGAVPIKSEPESAPGPWPPGAGAAYKNGGSATLIFISCPSPCKRTCTFDFHNLFLFLVYNLG